jgi:hypothetical protein
MAESRHTGRHVAPPIRNIRVWHCGVAILHKNGHGRKAKTCHQYPPWLIFDNIGGKDIILYLSREISNDL